MNRIIKKMTVVFLSLAITLLAFPAGILTAYAGAGKITFSDPTASVGNQVSVTMKIASSDGTALNKADVMLEYDAQAGRGMSVWLGMRRQPARRPSALR